MDSVVKVSACCIQMSYVRHILYNVCTCVKLNITVIYFFLCFLTVSLHLSLSLCVTLTLHVSRCHFEVYSAVVTSLKLAYCVYVSVYVISYLILP